MREHRSNMLLIELAIVLLFFTITQAITLQVFAKAQQLNRNATILNLALAAAENAAEIISVTPDAKSALSQLGFAPGAEGYTLVSPEGFRLTASIERFTQPAGLLTSITLHAHRGDDFLFALPTLMYQGGTRP